MAKRPEYVILAEYVWAQTGGKDFHSDVLNYGSMDIKKKDVKNVLESLVRRKYLTYDRGKEKPYVWTQAAKMIKAQKITFVDQQPTSPFKEIGLAGVAAVIAGASEPEAAPLSAGHLIVKEVKAAKSPVPKRKYVRKQAGPPVAPESSSPALPIVDAPTASPDPMLPDTTTVITPATLCEGEEQAQSLRGFLPLFLTPEEIPVFQLLGEVTENYLSADFFQDLELEGASLDLFLAKMYKLCILADGPEVMGQKKVFVFSKLAYGQHADNFFQVSASAALEKIRADLQQLKDEQEALQEQLMEKTVDAAVAENARRQSTEALEATKKELIEARQRLTEAENQEKEARRRIEEATENLQIAEAAVAAIEQEIAAADLDNRIVEIQSLEETATRFDQLHPLAYQQLLLSYLIIPVVVKEA